MRTLALFSLFVFAANAAEFTQTRVSADSSGTLKFTFRETGLTPGTEYTYEASAHAEANYWCVEQGARHPVPIGPTWTDETTVTNSETIKASKNGTASGEIDITRPPTEATPEVTACQQAGLVVVLHDITYDQFKLWHEGDGANATPIDGSINVQMFARTISKGMK